jgi:hypothetical protein
MSMKEQASGFVRVAIGSEHPARVHEIRFGNDRGALAGYSVRLGDDADAKWMAVDSGGFIGEAMAHGEAVRMVAAAWLGTTGG